MQRGLGRGLSALIPGAPVASSSQSDTASGPLLVPPERIRVNPLQPRRNFADADLAALAESVRQHGILQPLVVTRLADGAFELIAGERRLRAAIRAGLASVPVVVRDGDPSDRAKLELALVENVQREDLNPIERARAYAQLAEEFDLTQEEIAARVGVSRSAIAHALRLLTLPSAMQDALRDGRLSEGHAKLLAGMTDPAEQRAWFDRILANKLPVAAVAAGAKDAQRRHPITQRGGPPVGDANLRAKELALQRALGAKVTIAQRGSGGTITVQYADAEELAGILRTITRA